MKTMHYVFLTRVNRTNNHKNNTTPIKIDAVNHFNKNMNYYICSFWWFRVNRCIPIFIQLNTKFLNQLDTDIN